MARKNNFEEDQYNIPQSVNVDEDFEEEKEIKKPFLKKSGIPVEPNQEVQVRIVSENELLHLRLNEILAKVDEILAIAKQ
jgi:hypothetical protein